ncbi:NAD(P)/FAD-dependent oxidoreductase [Nocardioides acrostichi]|uniref:FAD-dependent oxidoreductase n=1 Tax=Nocardioides acrostichi TaxID=2784339 RepID=A0A930YE34_9ACTN|nr:FAD-dependent oxidoreductase [Nocardioides acrostichi]MBF4163104.1 FAD-dependent oxidoreductase [Nocardioides acrostichi]
MSGRDGVLVVGASLAGLRTVHELRTCGFDGAIRLLGGEQTLPYDRPPLSKGYLAGTVGTEAVQLTSEEELRSLDVEFVRGVHARSIDLDARRVSCDDGTDLAFDRLVAATGGHAVTPQWVRDLPGPGVLRTVEDADGLRGLVRPGTRVVIVGGGFVGSEVAATLCSAGVRVTLLVDGDVVLGRLGPRVAGVFTDLLRRRGVEVRSHATVIDATPDESGVHLVLADGTTLEGDLALAAVGSAPTTAWLGELAGPHAAPMTVDRHGRAHERVWGAGDVTGTGHWAEAVRQARVAARSIVGREDRTTHRLLDEVPYAWTDQFEVKVQTLGRPAATDTFHPLPGHDVGSLCFSGVYSRAGQVTGAVMADRPQDLARMRRHLAAPTRVSAVLDDAVASGESA